MKTRPDCPLTLAGYRRGCASLRTRAAVDRVAVVRSPADVVAESLTADEVVALRGCPETVLPPDVAASLPETTPGAPWRVRMTNLIWFHRPVPAASAALPAPLAAHRGRAVTNAGFVRYADTPVGPYSEVMAVPTTVAGGGRRGRVHIPFIAVDSVPSVHAGRAHWALPKVLARFDWAADGGRAEGDGWWLSARIVRRGPPIPVVGRSGSVQVRPDGRVGVSTVSMRGWGRLVRVEVDVDPYASFAEWLRPGRHLGLSTSATMTVGVPTWSTA